MLHDHILLGAITSADAELRRYALFGAAEGGNLTAMERAAVALAGLDADPRVASLAIYAMIKSDGIKHLDPITWQIIVRVIESATQSPHAGYRAIAAEMLKALPEPPTEAKPRLDAVRQVFRQDLLYSVRRWMA